MRELRYEDVSLCYRGDESTLLTAVGGLSLEVRAGEAVAIIGPSGCGKSTTLQLACGLLQPTAGRVLVDGEPLTAPRRDTALILQDFGLLPWKTVQANAELGLRVRGVPRAERCQRATEALELVGLEAFAHSYPSALSGGMRQRLALARSLALNTQLLLMDEPLSALDALLREQLQDTLLRLWQARGYAQVLVTHAIEEAVFLGQRIVVMTPRPGRVAAIVDNPQVGEEGYRATTVFHERCDYLRALLHEACAAREVARA